MIIVKYYFLYNILAQVAKTPGHSLPAVHFFGLKTSRLLARSNVCSSFSSPDAIILQPPLSPPADRPTWDKVIQCK